MGRPLSTLTPSAVPKRCRLDVVDRQRVAGEQHLHVAELDQARQVAPAPVCTTAGPATTRTRPPEARIWRISSAMPAISTFFGFSAETSLPMKLKISVCRERSSGVTRTPLVPDHDLQPRHGGLEDDAPCPAGLAVDRDRAVHLDVLDAAPSVPSMSTSVGRLLVE